MPPILTPRHLTARAGFYRQLAQFLSAGVSVVSALEHLLHGSSAGSFRKPVERILTRLDQGATFSESIRALGAWLPAFDIALLEAGEQSGRLDTSCRLLADYYDERARNARLLIHDLIYPAVLLHVAVLIFPFPQFFLTGNLSAYLRDTLGTLLPIYAFVAALLYAGQASRGELWRAILESLLGLVPVVGVARRQLALARLAAALEALLNAGVPILNAWELAAKASGSPALRRTVLAWKPQLESGQTPAEAVSSSREFPELFASFYQTGELSGSLDEVLRQLHTIYQEDGTRRLRAVVQWLPRLVYFAIVLFVGMRIVRFWLGYFEQIQSIGGP